MFNLRKTIPKLIGLAALLILAMLRDPQTARACTATPMGTPLPTREEQITSAEIILHGRVITIEEQNGFMQVATIQVNEYLKGSGPALVRMDHWGSGSMCLITVSVGTEAIFMAQGDPTDLLHASYFRGGSPIWPVNAFNEITAVVGQPVVTAIPVSDEPTIVLTRTTPPTEPTSLPTPVPQNRALSLPLWVTPLLWLVGFIMGAAVVALWNWLKRR